ncbi:ASKHA domain-containing protein [Clostridium estertheticum]|uniref:ASKHA domain-containing protein n=1 Tax=Clostridium estertheticum TaxID=238834 RepID=UPI0013E8F784|nr:ASKHA domain-containing protein [Clostridium estertheticum]MBZ9686181.1 ASKHA domain-containing protein [Clostridium estertheticum]
MVSVKFKNENITIEVKQGTKLSECIRIANLSIETPCNCMGLCGKCKVRVVGEMYPPSLLEQGFILNEENIRLACMAEVLGDVEVQLINTNNKLKTINNGYSIDVTINNQIKKIKLPEVDNTSPIPYIETIDMNVNSIPVFEKIAAGRREDHSEIYGVCFENNIIDIVNKTDIILGVAVDIGTTGISAYLVNLETGEVINKNSYLNPQTEYGGDVLSRISFAINNEDGTRVLRDSIVNKINEMVKELINKNYELDNVYRIMIAANTTMLHFFAGVNPYSIAKAPYRAIFLNKMDIRAREIGISINRKGIVTLLPSASAYVGADILAGIAATDFHKKKNSCIFIDIGTNGEIVAIAQGKMAATSTAAGPALEGMNISCGLRAVTGAIDSFNIDEDYNISFTTIDGGEAKGICGSALIDIAANMVVKEIVHKSGRFNKNLNEKISSRVRDKKFYITDDIYISQKDIRQIQLAKGAISAGISMLLKEVNISLEMVEEVVIAGAFGYHINEDSIKTIGLIPKGFKGRITFVGNSSIEGARLALINKDILETIIGFKNKIEIVELSTKDEFQDYFVEALSF